MDVNEHYREAMRLLDEANHVGHADPDRGAGIVAAAGVHADLAQALRLGDLVGALERIQHTFQTTSFK